VLLLQLPVPQLVPRPVTGNVALAAASLLLHARSALGPDLPQVEIASTEAMRRMGDAALVSYIRDANPSVLACTCTVWNIERTLYVIEQARAAISDLRVWLGGPEVAADSYFVQDRFPFDAAVEGEGENAFVALLADLNSRPVRVVSRGRGSVPCMAAHPERSRGRPPSPERSRGAGGLLLNPPALADLSSVHDPFVSGLASLEDDRVALVELWRGCRYGCTFCRYHQGRKGPGAARSEANTIEFFEWARSAGVGEVYVLDPSLEQRPDFRRFLDLLAQANGGPQIPLFVELRAEYVDDEIAAALAAAGVRRVEAGLQTLTPEALRLAGRKLDHGRFERGMEALRSHGIDVKVDLMLGLPGDTPDGMLTTLDFLGRRGFADNLQVFRTQALPGTFLRRRSQKLGIEFEPRPPYHVTHTPTWPVHLLTESISMVEDRLGTDLSLIEAPVVELPWPRDGSAALVTPLVSPLWGESRRPHRRGGGSVTPLVSPLWGESRRPHRRGEGSSWLGSTRLSYPRSSAVLQYTFDLGTDRGREHLEAERFQEAGTAVTLLFRSPDPTASVGSMACGVERLLSANPFTSVAVLLHTQAEFPLDVVDALDRSLATNRRSSYLERMAGRDSADRRLFVVLPAALGSGPGAAFDSAWLDALRSVAGVTWLLDCADEADAVRQVARPVLDFDDHLLVRLPTTPADLRSFFSALIDACPVSHRLMFSGVDLHWKYIAHLEHAAGTDW